MKVLTERDEFFNDLKNLEIGTSPEIAEMFVSKL